MPKLIYNRGAGDDSRWVTLHDDGRAVACRVARPMDVNTVNGRPVVTKRHPPKVVEMAFEYADEADLRAKARAFCKTGHVPKAPPVDAPG